jgi:hypothetical protein
MNPPNVYEETSPNTQRIIKMSAIFSSMCASPKMPSIYGDFKQGQKCLINAEAKLSYF